MALDIFHQVLIKLLDAAGGNPRQMVSIVDILRQEKLFGSLEMIVDKLQSEGWIADAPKKDHFYVTTWGIQEVRRTAPAPPPPTAAPAPAAQVPEPEPPKPAETKKPAEPKNAAALHEAAGKARELAATLEELATGAGGTDAQRKTKARKALAAAVSAVETALG